MKRNTGVSTSLFRAFVIAMLSACLISSPLWSLKPANATARESARNNQSSQALSHQQLQENQPRELLIKLREESSPQLEQVFEALGKEHHRLRGASNIVLLQLKDHLEPNATLAKLQQLDKVIEWVEPNYLVNRANVGRTVSSPGTRATRHSRAKQTPSIPPTIIATID